MNQFFIPQIIGWGGLVATVALQAGTLTLKPVADTTLFAFEPNNNAGREATMVVGGIRNAASACRTLVRFDLGTNLPPGAIITNVAITLTVTKDHGGPALQLGFHRMLRDWVEGTKTGQAGGGPANPGEATWNSRKNGNSTWTDGVGGLGDFVAQASAIRAIANPATYTVDSTAGLIADVIQWQTDPSTNFGWLLEAPQEAIKQSARRLAARENPQKAMKLTIGFTVPPVSSAAPGLVFGRPFGGAIEMRFDGLAGIRYELQTRSTVDEFSRWAPVRVIVPKVNQTVSHVVRTDQEARLFRLVLKP